MKLVVLDGYTENPGDLSWKGLEALGELTVYDRTSYTESPLIAQRIGDAEIVIMNKTPISRATIDACPNIRLIAVLATGYNVVDYQHAREKGIAVVNVPTYGTAWVSQFSIALLLEICHPYRPSQRVCIPQRKLGCKSRLVLAIGIIRSLNWRAKPSASSALAASDRPRAESQRRGHARSGIRYRSQRFRPCRRRVCCLISGPACAVGMRGVRSTAT